MKRFALAAALVGQLLFAMGAYAADRPTTVSSSPRGLNPNFRYEDLDVYVHYETDIDNSVGGAENLFLPMYSDASGDLQNFRAKRVYIRCVAEAINVRLIEMTTNGLDSTSTFVLTAAAATPNHDISIGARLWGVRIWSTSASDATALVMFE